MFDPIELMGGRPYDLKKEDKRVRLEGGLNELTRHHYASCQEYRAMLDGLGFNPNDDHTLEEFPALPVRLFKEFDLRSVPKEEVVKTLTSSGTSGQAVSKIHLSKENTKVQTRVLANIITDFIGPKRLPLLILDTEKVKKDRKMFSARGAGIIGFTTFGRDVCYALDENMELQLDVVEEFLSKHEDESILMFGYTYMLWQFVIRALENRGVSLGIQKGAMFHIGGWKKLKDQAVDTETFNRRVRAVLGDVTVHNYYGMAEQLGSVFVECEHGHMHCSNYSDILIRRFDDLSVAGLGEHGFIELMSLLPTSYPGHVLVTEDEGEILGEDDCPCGRRGKYFKIHGRVKGAEIRGCSDTYERR